MENSITTRKTIFLSPLYACLYEDDASLGHYLQRLLEEKHERWLELSDFEKRCLWYREQAIKSYAKVDFPALQHIKPPGTKKILEAEVKLWQSILATLRHLKGHGSWKISAELTLCEIIQESALVLLPLPFSSETEGKQGVDDCIAFYQKQNVKLRDSDALHENPFDSIKTPVTKSFIDLCFQWTDNSNFRTHWYMPIVRARQKLTTELKAGKLKSFSEKGQLKKGRKSENKVI